MYTSLFLDIDNTLLDFDLAEATAVRGVLASHGLPSDDEAVKTYSAINKGFWESFERGEIPKSAIFTGRFVRLLEVFGKEGNPEALASDYCAALADGHQLVEGAIDILKYLADKGYRLYATTNGLSSTQYKRIRESGTQEYFDGIFVSEDAGFQKPDKGYFDYVISHTGETKRSDILVIGDSQSSDILGGINAGLDTCWFNRYGGHPKYKSRYEISYLSQLKNIL